MIEHSITAKKEREVVPFVTETVPRTVLPFVRISTKLTYNNFINQLSFKQGDYAVVKSAAFPFSNDDYVRILEIQEVMGLVEWHESGEPKCLYARYQDGTLPHGRKWFAPCELIKVNSCPVIIPETTCHDYA